MSQTSGETPNTLVSFLADFFNIKTVGGWIPILTSILFFMEYQRLALLGVPLDLALSGFSVLTALVANLGVFLVLFLVLALGLAALTFLFVVLFAVLTLGLGYLAGVTTSGFRWTIRFLDLMTGLPLLIGKAGLSFAVFVLVDPSRKTVLTTKRDGLQLDVVEVLSSYLLAGSERVRTWREAIDSWMGSFKCWLVNVFIPGPAASLQIWWVRTCLVILIVLLAGVCQNYLVRHQYERMTEQAAAYAGSDLVSEQPAAWFWTLSGVMDHLGVSPQFKDWIAPPIRYGTLTVLGPNEGSHLTRSTVVAGAADKTFRSEGVFYLGDFGRWTYVARLGNIDDRLMVRSDRIIEFARFDEQNETGTECAAEQQPGRVLCLTVGGPEKNGPSDLVDEQVEQVTSLSATIVLRNLFNRINKSELADVDLTDLRSAIGRLEAAQERTDDRIVQFILGHSASPVPDPVLDSLNASLATLEAELNDVSENVEVLKAVNGEQPTWVTANEFSDLLDRVIAVQEALSEQRDDADNADDTEAPSEKDDPIDADSVATAVVAAVVEKFTFQQPWGPGWPGTQERVAQTLSDGVSTRSRGLLNDLDKVLDEDTFSECVAQYGTPLGAVDFNEGRVTGSDPRQIIGLWNQIHEGDTLQFNRIVLLRGGASDTGPHAINLDLSETRAEWVKQQLIRTALGSGHAESLERLSLVPIGDGERIGLRSGPSPRAVLAYVCAMISPDELKD